MKDYIVGIDPSFTRTGLALLLSDFDASSKTQESSLKGVIEKVESISVPTYSEDKYQLEYTMRGSDWLAREICKRIKSWSKQYNISMVVIEYPVLSTRSGSYLGLIQQALYMLYPWLDIPVIGVPANAIKSVTKYKTKSELVDWCRRHFQYNCETQRRGKWSVNHDECSGIVLAYIGHLVRIGKYKNSRKQFYSK